MAERKVLDLYISSSSIVFFHDENTHELPLADSDNVTIESSIGDILDAHTGKYSSLCVILSPSYVHMNQLSLPVMKRSDLLKVLERKVHVNNSNEEGINWGYQQLKRADKVDTLLTFVVAHSLVNTIISAATKKGISVQSILALPLLPFRGDRESDEKGSVLLILMKKSVLVRVHKGGKTLFTREFSCNIGADDPAEVARLNKEVERTLLYVKQQYQILVPTLYYVGREYPYISGAISGISYAGTIPQWVNGGVALLDTPTIAKANILPRSYIEEQKKIRQFYMLFVVIILLFIAMLGSYIFMSQQRRVEEKLITMERVDESADSIQLEIASMSAIEAKIQESQSVITYLESMDCDPVAGWAVAYISKIIPSRLVLSRFEMSYDRGQHCWHCRIEGFAPRSSVEAALLLKVLEERLSSSAFSLTVDKTWVEQWKENLHVGDTRDKELVNKRFYIEGRVF